MHNDHEFLTACCQWQPPKISPPQWRLYHDEQGKPLRYSMQDEPGSWIDISCAQYHKADFLVRVVDGEIQQLTFHVSDKLRPSHTGILCHVKDVALVVEKEPGRYWSKTHVEN